MQLELTPENNKAIKAAHKQLTDIVEKIHYHLFELVEHFEEASRIENTNPLRVDFDERYGQEELDNYDLCHTVGLINRAARNSQEMEKRFRFENHIKPKLDELVDFDSKYWPDIHEIIEELRNQYENATVKSYNHEIPEQIHKKKSINLVQFFTRIKRDIDFQHLAPELLSLSSKDWEYILNTATGEMEFSKDDFDQLKRNKNDIFSKNA